MTKDDNKKLTDNEIELLVINSWLELGKRCSNDERLKDSAVASLLHSPMAADSSFNQFQSQIIMVNAWDVYRNRVLCLKLDTAEFLLVARLLRLGAMTLYRHVRDKCLIPEDWDMTDPDEDEIEARAKQKAPEAPRTAQQGVEGVHITAVEHSRRRATDKFYSDLLHQVSTRVIGETRHETALRYIREGETRRHQGTGTVEEKD